MAQFYARRIDVMKQALETMLSCQHHFHGVCPECRQVGEKALQAANSIVNLHDAIDLIWFAANEPWEHAKGGDMPTYASMVEALTGIKQIARKALGR